MPDQPSEKPNFPATPALGRAAESLRRRGDLRGLVSLVEGWADVAEVPVEYRLLQVEALLQLCQTDRAWVRIKNLVEDDDPDPNALKIAGAMFIQRGWPQRAQKPLELAAKLLPHDNQVAELLARANNPVSDILELPDSDELHEVLPVAERMLSRGQLLKGQSLLERLRRNHPEEQRVHDLLWAIAGDYSLEHGSLSAFVQGLATGSLADFPAEADHTETGATPIRELPDEDSADDPSDFTFPMLFRGMRTPVPEKRDGTPVSPPRTFDDVTQSTNLADLAEIRDSVDAARRAAGFMTGEEFTEIRRIIRRPDGTASVDQTLGKTIPDSPFGNHTDHATPRVTGQAMDVDVEAEDDALIIVTKREASDADPELLELDPNTEAVEHPDAARFLAEAQELEQREAHEAEQTRLREERQRRIDEAKQKKAATPKKKTAFALGLTPGWLAAILALAFVAMSLFAVVLVLFGVF